MKQRMVSPSLRRVRARIVVAFSGLLMLTLGVNSLKTFAENKQADQDELNGIEIKVVDPNGKPVEGAQIVAGGLRTLKEAGSWHANKKMNESKTDARGIAQLQFPKYVYEKMETGQLDLIVTHPQFVSYRQDHAITGRIQVDLLKGRRIRLAAKDVLTGKQITEKLYVIQQGRDSLQSNWNQEAGGVYASAPLAQDLRLLLLVCVREGQPTLFSDLIDLADYPEGDCHLNEVALSPGLKVAGRLGDEVPRPIENGTVGLRVELTFSTGKDYRDFISWQDSTTIREDGTFEFRSVPRGAPAQLIAECNGWLSVSADEQQLAEFNNEQFKKTASARADNTVVAQVVSANNLQAVVVSMEKSASCEFTIVDDHDRPVPGAKIELWPNNFWYPGLSGMVGLYIPTIETLGMSDVKLQQVWMKKLDEGVSKRYEVVTDANGEGTIKNLPGKKSIPLLVTHDDFELKPNPRTPFHRMENLDLTPGEDYEAEITLQPKGAEVLGK